MLGRDITASLDGTLQGQGTSSKYGIASAMSNLGKTNKASKVIRTITDVSSKTKTDQACLGKGDSKSYNAVAAA